MFATQEIWVGNTEHETEPAATYEGAFPILRSAFATSSPRAGLPQGSTIAVIGYSDKVDLRQASIPIDAFDEAAFGVQRDYRGRTGSDLVRGIERAIDELASARPDTRRFIVLIGDGQDRDDEHAAASFAALAPTLRRHRIDVHALVVRSAVSPDEHRLRTLTDRIQELRGPDELPAALARVWRDLRGTSP